MASEPNDTPYTKFEPGIYFDLPNEAYHDADALGTTDFQKLYVDPASWWWDSRYNPMREEKAKDKDGLRFGSAAHVCLLEGIPAYEERFGIMPRLEDHEGALDKAEDLRAWLRIRDMKVGGNKPELTQRILEADPEAPIWARIVDETLAGRQHVTVKEDERLRLLRRVIDNMPNLADQLSTGLSELSMFWWDEEIEMMNRVRFDRITPWRVWDLKTFVRRDGIVPRNAALRSASQRLYHVQAAHYLNSTKILREFVREGKVFGGTPAEHNLLQVIACNTQDFGWLFYPSNGAPSPMSIPLPTGGLTLREGEDRLNVGRHAFKSWRDIYGLNSLWVSAAAEEPLDEEHEGYQHFFWRAA